MITIRRLLSVLALGTAGVFAADPPPLQLTAYINVSSGCQKPTEALLQELAAKYAGRLKVEVIDFGQPEGRKRWLAAGLHCMIITLDGSSKSGIVYKGVPLAVDFQMPPGHLWLLEELAAAVRQKLDGVSDQDREVPQIRAKAVADATGTVLADEDVILDGVTEAAAQRVGAVLQAATAARPLTQDDFTLDSADGTAKVSLRGATLLDFGLTGIPVQADSAPQVTARFLRLVKPFPRVSRPFPGSAPRKAPPQG